MRFVSVAIVVSFFICWSPFHAQRIMITSLSDPSSSQHSPTISQIFTIITYISGVTYYLTATINPILYQLMSLKFRLAFKDTFGIWFPCLKPRKIPEFFYSTGGPQPNGPDYTSLRSHRKGSSIRHNTNGDAIRHCASFSQLPSSATPNHRCLPHHLSTELNASKTMSNSCGEVNLKCNDREKTVVELNDNCSNKKSMNSTPNNAFLNVPQTSV